MTSQKLSAMYGINNDSDSDRDHEALSCSNFNPSRCLFCSHRAANYDNNLRHMRLKHGFIIPEQDRLVADSPTLIQYLHLVIAQDHECLLCGLARGSTTAAQHHMRGKNHCRLDLSDPTSEFRDFYEFPPPPPEAQEQQPVVAGMEMWLPSSGKMLQHRNQPAQKHHQPRPAKTRAAGALIRPGAEPKRDVVRGVMSDRNASKRGAKEYCLRQVYASTLRKGDRAMFQRMSPQDQKRWQHDFARDQRYAIFMRSRTMYWCSGC